MTRVGYSRWHKDWLSHIPAAPEAVMADDAGKFADALSVNVPAATEIAAAYGALPGRDVTSMWSTAMAMSRR